MSTGFWQERSGMPSGRMVHPRDNTHKEEDEDAKLNRYYIRPYEAWRYKQILAFPVHTPGHWTLGVLVNTAYRQDGGEEQPQWGLYHFDSYPSRTDATKRVSVAFAQFATGTRDSNDIRFIDIPVPGQKANSNDCALWPAHYLQIFLENLEELLKYCSSVSLEF